MRPILLAVLLVGSITSFGQDPGARFRRFSVQAGAGLTHYMNTLQVGSTFETDVDHIGFSFRIMREWEYRLSFGLETGYYPFYVVTPKPTKANPNPTGEATLTLVPILLNFRMRIVKNFYLTGGTGIGILFSYVKGLGNIAESHAFSMADFQLSALYLRPINDKFSWGAELKFLNTAKTEDYSFVLHLVGAYRF